MFSTRYFLQQIRTHFGHHPAPKRLWAQGAIGLVAVMVLWSIAVLGPLRIFVPHTFELTGWIGTDRTYLILFQNDTELRPTGGFLTSYGLLMFKNGIPTGLDFQDVYGKIDDHPYIAPPYPLDVLLEENSETYSGHSFRDANLNPDFSLATVDILSFFHKTYPDIMVDGVFAVNFAVLEDLIGLYGPLTIEDQTFTQINLFEGLENAVSDIDRHNVEALSTRKNIIKALAGGLMQKMLFRPWNWTALSHLIVQELDQKNLLLHFQNDDLQQNIEHLGWAGTLPSPDAEADRLIVNVANYGGMKSDRYITRDVTYTVTLTDQKDEQGKPLVLSDLEVMLHHNGDYNTPLSGSYKGYVRVFLPEGATLIESSTQTSTPESLPGYNGWGDIVRMEPGESMTFRYVFQRDARFFEDEAYALQLVKQSGTQNDLYTVVVKTPIGENISSSLFETHENMAYARVVLEQDHLLKLRRLKDELPPRLFWQRVTDLNVIELTFAEPLASSWATDPLNYTIVDLNKNHPEVNDTLTVDFITLEGGAIRIYTKGMTLQSEEHYQLTLQNLRDRNGNPIHPNPRTVTVVQQLK